MDIPPHQRGFESCGSVAILSGRAEKEAGLQQDIVVPVLWGRNKHSNTMTHCKIICIHLHEHEISADPQNLYTVLRSYHQL